MRRSSVLGPAVAALLLSSASLAQPEADPAIRATARKLADEGLALAKKGDCKAALDKFNRADSLVPALTLDLEAARCLVKLGRLVEASERYLEITREVLPRSAPPVLREAQAAAIQEREELMPRIPMLEVMVEGGGLGKSGKVILDDKEIPPATLATMRPIDPGKHTLVVKRRDTTFTKELSINERARVSAEIELPPLPPEPLPPPVEDPNAVRRTLAWVSLGIGGAGLVMGTVSGIVALDLDSDLLARCGVDRLCTANEIPTVADQNDVRSTVGAHDLTRALTTVGLVVGVAGVGAGLTLLLTTPRHAERASPRARISPWIGPASAGISGVF